MAWCGYNVTTGSFTAPAPGGTFNNIISENARRIFLSVSLLDMVGPNFADFQFGNWGTFPTPVPNPKEINHFIGFGNNTPFGHSWDYRHFGPLMQMSVSVNMSQSSTVEWAEITIDNPSEVLLPDWLQCKTLYHRMWQETHMPANSIRQILPANSQRVMLYIWFVSSQPDAIYFGSGSTPTVFYPDSFPIGPLIFDSVGPLIQQPVAWNSPSSGGFGSLFVSEVLAL